MTSVLNHALHYAVEGIYPPPTGNLDDEWHDKDGDFYNDGKKWIRTDIELPEISVSASKLIGLLGFSAGVGCTGAFGVGPQSNLDLVWLFTGPDASIFPNVVVSGAAGAGYSIDIDLHGGPLVYHGYKSDLSAINVLNTGIDGGGYTFSASGSLLGELGLGFSMSQAAPNTRVYGLNGSAGLSLTPGFNFFGGKYVSQKVNFK
jgi:hypothetical protein